jgi:hypothetical protein
MRTPKQTQASRANGAKSKGPVTPQGKLNSSRNATRHGLLAETIVLEAEDKAPFLELLNELMEEHQPQTRTETMLVETLAAARWRQDRIWGMQKIAFDYDVSSSAALAELNPLRAVLALRNSPESVRTHELLLRYEIALDRQISRTLLRLHQLQDRSAKGAPHSVLRDSNEGAKSAPHSVLRDSKNEVAVTERTQQPVETVAPLSPPAAAVTVQYHQRASSNPPSQLPPSKQQAVSPSAARRKPNKSAA